MKVIYFNNKGPETPFPNRYDHYMGRKMQLPQYSDFKQKLCEQFNV